MKDQAPALPPVAVIQEGAQRRSGIVRKVWRLNLDIVISAQAGIHNHDSAWKNAVAAASFDLQRQRLWISGSAVRSWDEASRAYTRIGIRT
jgi:hypothetical protein